jgi:hypothetical protein
MELSSFSPEKVGKSSTPLRDDALFGWPEDLEGGVVLMSP